MVTQNGLQAPEEPAQSRELVTLGVAGREASMAAMARPLAGFLTQLLACRDQLPAYRARRRAEPNLAVATYADRDGAPRISGHGRLF